MESRHVDAADTSAHADERMDGVADEATCRGLDRAFGSGRPPGDTATPPRVVPSNAWFSAVGYAADSIDMRGELQRKHVLDETPVLGDLVIEPPGRVVVFLRVPVHASATLVPSPVFDGPYQRPRHALATRLGRREKVLKVADIGCGRADVHQEVGDSDQAAMSRAPSACILSSRWNSFQAWS